MALTRPASREFVEDDFGVGDVFESDAKHWLRHRWTEESARCCRCHFIRNKTDLEAKMPWLAPRPAHLGGHWRLGCAVCHWRQSCAPQPTKRETRGSRGNDIRGNKFAKFDVSYKPCSFYQLQNRLEPHRHHCGHKVAVLASLRASKVLPARLCHAGVLSAREDGGAGAQVHMRPLLADSVEEADSAVEAVVEKAAAEVRSDQDILKGRVPQCKDWLDTWADSTEMTAFRKQVRLKEKRGERMANTKRYVRRNQVRIMAEIRREDIRRQLRAATCISLSLDERKYQKIGFDATRQRHHLYMTGYWVR